MLFGESELVAIVIKRTQVNVRRRMLRLNFENLMVGGNGVGLSAGILFQCNAPRKPGRDLVLAWSGLGARHRCSGHNFLALGKIHKELARNRLQQFALMTKRYAVLGSRRCSSFEQR